MLIGTIIATVNREPKTGQGKNGKDYCMLPLHRKVQYGDRTFDKYYTAMFSYGQGLKDATRCKVGDIVAVAFDDVQADSYEGKDGKAKAGVKLSGQSCVAITGSTPTSGDSRQEPTERQKANLDGPSGKANADDSCPF